LKIGAVIIVVAVGGYFGFGLVSSWQEKANAKRRDTEKQADGGQVGHIGDLYNVLDTTDPDRRGAVRSRASAP